MLQARVIPCLLLRGAGLVKGVQFRDHSYVGDPINAVKIFNDKEVDELVLLDIAATREARCVSTQVVKQIADECYMPFAVGGGIRTTEEIRSLLSAGAEKVIINSSTVTNPKLISEASSIFGNQSIVVSIDVKKTWRGKQLVRINSGTKSTSLTPVEWAQEAESLGAGEILLASIDRDGTMSGYDIDLVISVTSKVNIPVIACGGAGNVDDIGEVISSGGASAAAAGSLFVFHGRRRAVLISFPTAKEIEGALLSIAGA